MICDSGRTALHEAAANTPAVAQLLLDSNPAAVMQADDYGCVPLFYARSEATAALLVAAAPAAAAVVDEDGQYALHCVAARGSAGLVRLVLAAHPPAARMADVWGRLPLHDATCLHVAELLLQAAPDCAMQPDKDGKLPLHYAVSVKQMPTVHMLLAAAPVAATICNSRGQLPLHLALRYKCTPTRLPAFQALVAATPVREAVTVLAGADNSKAALPLFAAAVGHAALSDQDWKLVPTPCASLATVLPAVHARSRAEAGQLVQRLPPAAQARLRTAAMVLAPALPAHIFDTHILPFVVV